MRETLGESRGPPRRGARGRPTRGGGDDAAQQRVDTVQMDGAFVLSRTGGFQKKPTAIIDRSTKQSKRARPAASGQGSGQWW
ncbi:hypothetical protein C7S16_1064 [Burkholderia thailandensis]|uniref:Uncharacterized protein n=1 Tax=Burkholderia thailandensis TaxID=57975 RepID=A0AAW9CZ76_BURTH|nr:hypothetical protein [Burkholderia thailandensis]MDW9255899.1 hypothetical protein [Burkholderia thailandensis]